MDELDLEGSHATEGKAIFLALLKNNILTWEVFQSRGFVGPGRRPLCLLNLDMVSHLFGDCTFLIDLWLLLMIFLKIEHSWMNVSVEENLQAWYNRKYCFGYLPFLCCGRSGRP